MPIVSILCLCTYQVLTVPKLCPVHLLCACVPSTCMRLLYLKCAQCTYYVPYNAQDYNVLIVP